MEKTEKQTKITGWLWMPAIGLIITPISFISKNIAPFLRNHYPYRLSVDYTIMLADIFLLVLVGILSWYFFKCKKHSHVLYVIYVLIMVLMWLVIDGVHESQNDPPFIAMFFYCMVVVPYLVLSKNAKETFIAELQSSVFIERIVMSSSKFLTMFYAFLSKNKWMIFVLMFAFLFASIILNCALRSIRIDGDISHTIEYL
jgi:hypothetical protein